MNNQSKQAQTFLKMWAKKGIIGNPERDLIINYIEELEITKDCLMQEVEKLSAENQQYKDKLTDGQMIELPCKVGDDLYSIVDKENIKRYPNYVLGFLVLDNKIRVYTKDNYCIDLNEDMYLTLSEAEQALKEKEADND